jgi:hypothetical protein
VGDKEQTSAADFTRRSKRDAQRNAVEFAFLLELRDLVSLIAGLDEEPACEENRTRGLGVQAELLSLAESLRVYRQAAGGLRARASRVSPLNSTTAQDEYERRTETDRRAAADHGVRSPIRRAHRPIRRRVQRGVCLA